ncbi:MAG: carboxypeptidase-like regulatory domain-containing protein, partial [Candidatus Aminicenantes bacterium]|nr:carboxypeptidase-like regulatory domain-containing protein [Candidatus Aminicenantes bacterium]
MKIKAVIPVLGLILIVLVSAAWARETGEIRGRVTDEKGEFLPGVAIYLQSHSLQGVRTTVTSLKGEFHFPLLPVGTYRLTAELDGFPSL